MSYAYFVFVSWLMHLLPNDIWPRIWTHMHLIKAVRSVPRGCYPERSLSISAENGEVGHDHFLLSWSFTIIFPSSIWQYINHGWPDPLNIGASYKFVSHTQTWPGQHQCSGTCCACGRSFLFNSFAKRSLFLSCAILELHVACEPQFGHVQLRNHG